MPSDVPKPGSVAALRQAWNNRETQAQTEAQKPATFRSRSLPVTPRPPAQTRIAAPARHSPSPPPSRLAEAIHGTKNFIASLRSTTPAKTQGTHPVSAPASAPSTPPALTPSDITIQGFGRRETVNFEWPAGPKTDYAYERHGHHKTPSSDTSIPPPLPANTSPKLHPINDTQGPSVNGKPPSRLKKLSEADSNSPLAKFRRTDTKNIKAASGPPTAVLPISVHADKAVVPVPSPLSGPLSVPAPQRQVHDRIAVIEAVAHESVLSTPELAHQSITPFFSPSDQANHVPGAFTDFDASYFPKQPSSPAQNQQPAQKVPNIVTTVPATTVSGLAPNPVEVTTPLLAHVVVPYYECPSPVDDHMHDKEEDELTRVGQVLDDIVREHRAALEDIIGRLGKELRGMKHQYDNADIPEPIKKQLEPFPAIEVNKVPEDEMKVEHHENVHDHHFPEPHRSIATLAPKINEQTSVLLALMRQIKEVATVWSVDLEQVECQPVPVLHKPNIWNYDNKLTLTFLDTSSDGLPHYASLSKDFDEVRK